MHQLTDRAFTILVKDLESHGNVLSEAHRAALYELVDRFTDYVYEKTSGRQVFSLATGLGKTSAVAAFVSALHQLDIGAAVAVSASQVEALCRLKQEFRRLGVPEEKIGLKHSLLDASEPSTGDESRQFQLVTHARVRAERKADLDLFNLYGGKKRSLMIYDETLLRSDAVAVSAMEIASGLGALGPRIKAGAQSVIAQAHAYVGECSSLIEGALTKLRESGDSSGRGEAIVLPYREEDVIKAYRDAIQGSGIAFKYVEDLQDLLKLSQKPVRVLSTAQGHGLIWCEERVPKELTDICVLDASHPVRTLAQADDGLVHVNSWDDSLKSFEHVAVYQYLAGGGRESITKAAGAYRRERSALSQEVIEMVQENWETAGGILIFTYNARTLDIVDKLRQDLRYAGFDLKAKRSDGKPKVQFLTWGQETSLNGYEHCDVVILAGVMQRSFLDIVTTFKGQKGNPSEPASHDLVVDAVESEVAHLVYQAASRGSCRRIINGKALAMKLYFVHRDPTMSDRILKVMPKASWNYRTPKYLKAAKVKRVQSNMVAMILDHLRGMPQDVDKVSCQAISKALNVGDDPASRRAFTRAIEKVTTTREWGMSGKSLVRGFRKHFGIA